MVETRIHDLLEQTPIGNILQKALEINNPMALVTAYLHDFVRMAYKPRTKQPEKEYKVRQRKHDI